MTRASIIRRGINCWRQAAASRFTLLVDGENYFRAVRGAALRANERIIIVGWDFDARIKMYDTQGQTDDSGKGPLDIGSYIDWLVAKNPDLQVYIVQWSFGAAKAFFRGRTFLTILRWYFHPRIHLRFDSAPSASAAQHEKLIVVDRDVAFCGGIDITADRWDTRHHRDVEPKRDQPSGQDFGPWHDAAAIMQGDIAGVLADLVEDRWRAVTGSKPNPVASTAPCWPGGLTADLSGVSVAVSRTRPATAHQASVKEIECLYADCITAAKHRVYIESQYFTSWRLAGLIARRLAEADGPEFVIVTPSSAQGWLEPKIMDTTRARLIAALKKHDKFDRFAVYHPETDAGTPIYVHAKIVVVDDQIFRIGSSNISNRSMGHDGECDVTVEAVGPHADQQRAQIAGLRNDLMAEHLGISQDQVESSLAKTQSLIETIAEFSATGRKLRPYQMPDLNRLEAWLAENDILDPVTDDQEAPEAIR